MATWSHADTDEVIAIRSLLEDAGIPKPMGSGARHTATWVAVALAELRSYCDREAAAEREAVERAAAKVRETQARMLASERVQTRAERPGCPNPTKAAYDVARPDEVRLADRRRRANMDLYLCECGWSHLGHKPGAKVAALPPPMPSQPLMWAAQKRRVVLLTGGGQEHAVGEVVAYEESPTVQVRTDHGRVISWRADLARAAGE